MPFRRCSKRRFQRRRTLGGHLGDRSGSCSRCTAWRSSSASPGTRPASRPRRSDKFQRHSRTKRCEWLFGPASAGGGFEYNFRMRSAIPRLPLELPISRCARTTLPSFPHRIASSLFGGRAVVHHSTGCVGCERSGGSGRSQVHGLSHLALPSRRYRPSHGPPLGPPHDLYCERGRHRRCDVESVYNDNRLFLALGRRRPGAFAALRRSWLSETPLRTALRPRSTKIRLGPPCWPADWHPASPPRCWAC